MPPAGNPRPDNQAIQSFVSWMEANLDHAADHPRGNRPRGPPPTEPQGIHERHPRPAGRGHGPGRAPPRDDARDGFDNVADALQVSPSFLDQYLAAAAHRGGRRARQRERPPGRHHLHLGRRRAVLPCRRRAAWHPRRHRRHAPVPGGWRVRHQHRQHGPGDLGLQHGVREPPGRDHRPPARSTRRRSAAKRT